MTEKTPMHDVSTAAAGPAARREGRSPRGARGGLAAVVALSFLTGCEGMASGLFGEGGGGGGGGTPDPGGNEVVARPAVTLPTASLRLLPFDVRLRRVADGVGLSVDDKVFDTARKNRLALGAHDFANRVAPDLSWNAQHMAVWVEAMLPVCRDTRVRSGLGDWTLGGVEKFVDRAYGRASTADDVDALSAALAVTGDDGWVLACVSLASSAEVMLQ